MQYQNFYETDLHSYQEYENSHKPRLDFLVKDLSLNELFDKNIADVGCGLGFIHDRLHPDIQKNYYGYDGAIIKNPRFNYMQVDLDNFSTDKEKFFDVVMCFETLEHLTNPYVCLLEIKKMLKPNGFLLISIPHEATTHNTIYPGLMYPVENFVTFLKQMAFEVVHMRYHNKSFHQHVFVLKSHGWDSSEMLWYKAGDNFRNIPPHISINI